MDNFLGKSVYSKNTILHYANEHSLRLIESQEKLNQKTKELSDYYMMGAPEVLNLNSNLMKCIGAKRVLDIGIYTGCSALSAALAIPNDGQVYALDITDEYLKIGRPFWKEANVDHKINVIIGDAVETLKKLINTGNNNAFDFAFLDADKTQYNEYYECCLKLVRSGGIIAIDNTLWGGKVIDRDDMRSSTISIRELNEKLRDDERITLSLLPIGDGLTLCFKK